MTQFLTQSPQKHKGTKKEFFFSLCTLINEDIFENFIKNSYIYLLMLIIVNWLA